jgi:hypothetical protein
MRIYYDDPDLGYIRVDRAALAAFLQAQGVSEERIKQLYIRIRRRIPKSYVSEECREETTLGVSYNNSVIICTWQSPRDANKLNQTLLHELRHFMKKGCYGPDNYALAYADRPSEKDARAFAEQHKHHRFISFEDVLSLPVAAPAPSSVHVAPSPALVPSSAAPFVVLGLAILCVLLRPAWSYLARR